MRYTPRQVMRAVRCVFGSCAVAVLMSVGCAGAPPPPPPSEPAQRVLTVEEVRAKVASKVERLNSCYRGEALNSPQLSSFVFQLDIPKDASQHEVTLVSESVPGQRVLRECIADVLRSVRFPSFDHDALTAEVPIEPAS